ncbi:MAG: glycosyltransferase family 1 protein [bacterium]
MNTKLITIGVNTLFYIPGEVGGTETYLRQTLRAMAEQVSGDRLVVFTNLENEGVLKADLAAFPEVVFVPLKFRAMSRPQRIIREQIELPGKVKASGVDVLWSPGYTAPVLASCPQGVSIHDMQYKAFPQDLGFFARLMTDILVKAAARRCDRIIAGSRFSRDEIVKHTSARAGKVEVVAMAASPMFSEPLPEERRRALVGRLIPFEKPYLLCVAATYPHKNVQAVVTAFGKLMPSIPHNLVLVGNARLGEPEVQKALYSLADPSRVIRLRKLTEVELVALYQGCEMVVHPSRYEGFGLPVLEGLMAGVPVVTTRCASIPEVGGEVALYFDPGDPAALPAAIREVLGWSTAERQARIKKGRDFAKAFSWSTTAAGTLKILRGISNSA